MVRIQNGFGLWWRNNGSLMCMILVCRIPTILYLSGFLVLRVRLAWKRPPPELFLEAVLCDDWPLVPENTGSPLVINEVFSTFVSLLGAVRKLRWQEEMSRLSKKVDFFTPHIAEIICTMRTNLLNWCNLVSISKNVVFYVFLVVRIY